METIGQSSGKAIRKEKFRNCSSKGLVHFIAGCRVRKGVFVPHSDPSIDKADSFPTLGEVRKVLATVHPVLNEPVVKGGSPDATIKGWMRHGRLHRGGTPARSGAHPRLSEDDKAYLVSVVAKVCGFAPPATAKKD